MKKNEEQTKRDFKGYENARQNKNEKNPEASSEKSIKAATNRINLDENLLDRG